MRKSKKNQKNQESLEERVIKKSKQLYEEGVRPIEYCIIQAIQTDAEISYAQFFSLLGVYSSEFVKYIKEKMQNEVK